MKRHLDHVWIVNAYPSIGVGPGEPDVPATERYKWKCEACKNYVDKRDSSHTRIPGDCSREHDTSIEYSCVGCKELQPAAHHTHTYIPDQCKWAVTLKKRSKTRQGQRPRQGRTPATDDETKDAQAQLLNGTDFAQGDEDEFPAPLVGGSSASTSQPNTHDNQDEGLRVPTVHPKKVNGHKDGITVKSDWSKFELGTVLRVLKTAQNRATLERELRNCTLDGGMQVVTP